MPGPYDEANYFFFFAAFFLVPFFFAAFFFAAMRNHLLKGIQLRRESPRETSRKQAHHCSACTPFAEAPECFARRML